MASRLFVFLSAFTEDLLTNDFKAFDASSPLPESCAPELPVGLSGDALASTSSFCSLVILPAIDTATKEPSLLAAPLISPPAVIVPLIPASVTRDVLFTARVAPMPTLSPAAKPPPIFTFKVSSVALTLTSPAASTVASVIKALVVLSIWL
ncbi:hypothetical protein SDC9_110224 [bioreactor metagenome]|uniref:Uncharacterized protein n=1 Tax=bioreactor metagenome TaxID=1076179 RepID=A0A645BNH6_9ZZZZ